MLHTLQAEVTQMVRDRLTSQLSSSVAGPLTDSIVASVTEVCSCASASTNVADTSSLIARVHR